ncbi:MAG: hypothetical protein IJT70_05785 [Clostridia bacterium]|nr:hypothetical protein [Clostridia bacterium]
MESSNQINLGKFLGVLRRRAIWIIIIALIAGTIAGALTMLLVTPQYVSYATFYVNANDSQNLHITQSDISVAKSLVDTYIVILKSDTFLESVSKSAGLTYSPGRIRSGMRASAVEGTEVFRVTITDKDPKNAYLLASALAEKAPTEIKRVVECGNVSIIDPPKVATKSNDIGLKKNVVIGLAAGAAVAFAIFFLIEVLDVTIYTEEDITDSFSYPVIGTIPSILSASSRQKAQKGYGNSYETAPDQDEKKEEKQ